MVLMMFVRGHVAWVDTLSNGIAEGHVALGVKGVGVLDTLDSVLPPF